MKEFYCGSCNKTKKIELKVVRKAGRPVCRTCFDGINERISKERLTGTH
ncbi:MAG: hypothetical protein JRI72_17780 [Deltaproteobacteria bacterium]|nr:hypothetical protein [Deltaproteobacteria bacterium]